MEQPEKRQQGSLKFPSSKCQTSPRAQGSLKFPSSKPPNPDCDFSDDEDPNPQPSLQKTRSTQPAPPNRTSVLSQDSNDSNEPLTLTKSVSANSQQDLTMKDFKLIKELGRGAYGDVILVQRKDNSIGKPTAIKCVNRRLLEREEKEHQIIVERTVLTSFRHRSLIKLFSCFKDTDTLYLEIEYCSNGEFSKY